MMTAMYLSDTIIFGCFIYLTVIVAVNSADKVKDELNYDYNSSDYVVIKQEDPRDNTRWNTYDNFDFMRQIRTNERNIKGLQNSCSKACSSHLNEKQRSHADSTGKYTDFCRGRLRDCVQYKRPEKSSFTVGIKRLWYRLSWAFGGQDEASLRHHSLELLLAACPTCECACDEFSNPNVTSSVCLDPVMSNVADGYIVTGIQFKIVDKILRIQIQQGKLAGNIIDSKTRKWQETSACKKITKMKYDSRSLRMDDIILPEEFVVTGVSLNLTENSKGFYLSVYGKPVKELTNVAIDAKEFHSPPGDRIDLITPDMDIPTASQEKNTESSTPGQSLITFQSVRSAEDVNSNDPQLMPFLDIKGVVSDSEIKLLRGVGIYWRGQKGYGGYVAFKLFVK